MTEKLSGETAQQIPKFNFVEGRDYWGDDELIELVTQKLKEIGVSEPDTVLLCGYDGNNEYQHEGERKTTFAYSVAQTREELEYYSCDNPFEYAKRQGAHGGIPTVAAFDSDYLAGIGFKEYQLREGATLKDATLLTVTLFDS